MARILEKVHPVSRGTEGCEKSGVGYHIETMRDTVPFPVRVVGGWPLKREVCELLRSRRFAPVAALMAPFRHRRRLVFGSGQQTHTDV